MRGGVVFDASLAEAARVVLRSRAAVRVILQLGRAPDAVPEALAEAARRIEWEDHLPHGASLAVRAIGRSPALRHERFVAQVVKDGIVDRLRERFGVRPEIDPRRPDVLVDARIESGGVALGLDLGGGSLHERGTGRSGPAPLREDVAAGVALLVEADAAGAIFDPFCGTGTLVAEAAGLALGVPPGRDPAGLPVSRLPEFRRLPLAEIAAERAKPPRAAGPALRASDASRRAVDQARRTLARQGLAGAVELTVAPVPKALPPTGGPGLVLTNPPWGVRLDPEASRRAWHGLGTLARSEALSGWTLAALSGDASMTRELGLRASRKFPLRVGGVDARLLVYPLRR